MSRYPEIAFTPDVRAAQEAHGSGAMGAKMLASAPDDVELTERERAFIAERDSFFVASVGSSGWPYIQHRGGPRGILRVVDDRTLAFADFRGNRQYITNGNVVGDDRVSLFLLDYPNRRRLEIYARARFATADEEPELARLVTDPDYGAKIEHVVALHVEAFDWNCPQHITPRWTLDELEPHLAELRRHVADLVAENARLREGGTQREV